VPLPFRDVDRELWLEQEPDSDGLLSPSDPEGVLRVCLGIEIRPGREPGARWLDLAKPGECKRRDSLLGRVPREHVPVAVIRQQVVGAQCVLRDTPVKGLVRDPDLLAALDEARNLRPDLGIDSDAVLRHDPHVLAQPVWLDSDVARQ
jgi:hypothetical protein